MCVNAKLARVSLNHFHQTRKPDRVMNGSLSFKESFQILYNHDLLYSSIIKINIVPPEMMHSTSNVIMVL